MSYQIKFEVYGPEGEPDERGYTKRERLTEIEHIVPAQVAAEVISETLKLLGKRMELSPPTPGAFADAAREQLG